MDVTSRSSRAWSPVERVLRRYGFERDGRCFVRDVGPVRQLVEPQRAVYAPRVTLNLGLSLSTLSPILPWVGEQTSLLAVAQRWTRLGRVTSDGRDRWWDVGTEGASAYREMAAELRHHGLPWLDRESASEAFSRFAKARRERTASELSPEGGFGELRLSIAVHCWRRERDEARRLLEFARIAWRVEHGRLEHARRDFSESQDLQRMPEPVPDLLAELEAMVTALG